MTKTKDTNALTPWYKTMPKHLIPKYENPCFDDHLICIPCRIIIVGCSGSGKTQLGLDIIKRMKGTFGNIIVCTMNAKEPLYEYLKSKIDEDQLQIYEGIENVPSLEELDDDVQHLVIFDDLCLAKNQDIINQYFIRGRKIAKGVSVLYLTQSFYRVPKVCRINSTMVFLKKLSTMRDLRLIISDFDLGVSRDELMEMYKYCTNDGGFLNIDVNTNDTEKRYRKNFTAILDIGKDT